jgi:raffinose/stachyose/melibiose transport system substrate-binding protein
MKRIFVLLLVAAFLCSMLMVNVLADDAKITLRMGDNVADRNSPTGQVIEQINKDFKAKHPNVEIVTESYPDQPYQEKIKIYAASNQLPDVFKWWSFSTLLQPLAESGNVMELNEKDYTGLGFLPGSLDSNKYNGKLYGLPFSMDYWVLYYNKALFAKYKVKVPTTLDELKAAAKVFNKNNVIPVVTDGKDCWSLCLVFENVAWRVDGDFSLGHKAYARKDKFTNPAFVTAAQKIQDLVKAKVFNADLVTSDYGAAQNLFGQEKAAMYMMGSWEMSLASNTNFSEHFRNNVGAVQFPADTKGKGNINDLMAWYGGNYVISANTKYKDLCLEYLKLYFTELPGLIWKAGGSPPAQKVTLLPTDNNLKQDLVGGIIASAKRTSGIHVLDSGTAEFKEAYQKLTQELFAGLKTPQQFCQALDDLAAKVAGK